MKLILLEGLDKSGKSTIANWLKDNYDFEIIKFSAPKKGDDVYKIYLDTLNKLKPYKNYVIDRMHWSEAVYGPIYREKSQLDQDKLWNIDEKINELNGIVVYCFNDIHWFERKFKEDKEEFTQLEDIMNLIEAYKKVEEKSATTNFYHMIDEQDVLKNNDFLQYLYDEDKPE